MRHLRRRHVRDVQGLVRLMRECGRCHHLALDPGSVVGPSSLKPLADYARIKMEVQNSQGPYEIVGGESRGL